MRFLVDTNVLISAFVFGGKAALAVGDFVEAALPSPWGAEKACYAFGTGARKA